MNRAQILTVLRDVSTGSLSLEEAAERLRVLPFEAIGEIGVVDHHRELRTGVPEVVLGEFKTADQIAQLMAALAERGNGALATRVDAAKAAEVVASLPQATYHCVARAVRIAPAEIAARRGTVAIVCAGTSDLPVAEEAAITAEFLGLDVDRLTDVGVAGLQRLLAHVERLRAADVLIVIAGMEGALPSVIAGLVERLVIAVPTSVGYGVGLGGYAAMMGMLSSCSAGILVTNIDNGFGAAVGASVALASSRGAAANSAEGKSR